MLIMHSTLAGILLIKCLLPNDTTMYRIKWYLYYHIRLLTLWISKAELGSYKCDRYSPDRAIESVLTGHDLVLTVTCMLSRHLCWSPHSQRVTWNFSVWNYGNVYCGAALSKNPDHGSYGSKARCGELPPPSRLGVLRRRLSPKQGERFVA